MLVPITLISPSTNTGTYASRAPEDSGISNTIYINTDLIMSMRRSHVKEDVANYMYAGYSDIVTLQIRDDSGATSTKSLQIPLSDAYDLLTAIGADPSRL